MRDTVRTALLRATEEEAEPHTWILNSGSILPARNQHGESMSAAVALGLRMHMTRPRYNNKIWWLREARNGTYLDETHSAAGFSMAMRGSAQKRAKGIAIGGVKREIPDKG